MRRVVVRASLVLGLVLVIAVAWTAWKLYPRLANLSNEYETAQAIVATTTFVAYHHGQWPRSWTDLGLADRGAQTRMNFALDPTTATRDDVQAAILPATGRYYTYPHARAQLDALWDEIQKQRDSATPPSDGGAGVAAPPN